MKQKEQKQEKFWFSCITTTTGQRESGNYTLRTPGMKYRYIFLPLTPQHVPGRTMGRLHL